MEPSRASSRDRSRVIQVEQVRRWFQSRQNERSTDATASPIASEELGIAAEASFPHIVKGEMISEVMDLKFEARAKDGGWYDVAMFLSHRFLSSGKPEVLVSFQGFSSEEDEWVSVKAVRERSIPIDSSECWKVAVGDLVLCFRETSDGASHFDAHVVEIQKKLHDMRGCRCIFLIRYDHDQTEERVHLRQLCRRPP